MSNTPDVLDKIKKQQDQDLEEVHEYYIELRRDPWTVGVLCDDDMNKIASIIKSYLFSLANRTVFVMYKHFCYKIIAGKFSKRIIPIKDLEEENIDIDDKHYKKLQLKSK